MVWTLLVIAFAATLPISPLPVAQQECVQFKSPTKLQVGSEFRAPLLRGLEFRLSKEWEISVRPIHDDTDYLWLVSPPLRTAPQRKLGRGYGLSAPESAAITRTLHFVLNRVDYDAALASHNLEDAAQTLKVLDQLGRGLLLVYVDKFDLDGDNFRWISFHGEACVPK
jgi:hypothetical protein